jgi:alpha/beta superfamily hydrolase
MIAGPTGDLEALLEEPEMNRVDEFAVVCHPHPLYQGTMTNKVVHTLARAFQELGMATVRFNFRGVGQSAGVYDEGDGETEDCLAVVDWARKRWPNARPSLGGFSFGAWIAIKAASRIEDLVQLVTIAPPVHRVELPQGKLPSYPWLIVQGSDDELVDCDGVVEWVNSMAPGPELVVLEGVDHFFHGRLNDLKSTLLHNLNRKDA